MRWKGGDGGCGAGAFGKAAESEGKVGDTVTFVAFQMRRKKKKICKMRINLKLGAGRKSRRRQPLDEFPSALVMH